MAHHKRGRRKSARSGCAMCKPHKQNGFKGKLVSQTLQERRALDEERLRRKERQSDW